MNSSFLYHAWGLYHHKCLREEHKGNTIILHIESKRAPKCCPKCGHPHLVKNGFRTRDFISLPIGGKKVILRMKVRRYKCKRADCDYDCQERISFVPDSHSYTRRFARYVVDLLKGMTPKTQSIFWVCRGTRSKRFTLIILSVAMLHPLLREWTVSA